MCKCVVMNNCPECCPSYDEYMAAKKPTPHKHAELIKAWADGAKIEYLAHDKWYDIGEACSWSTKYDYRIKPEPKPDSETITANSVWNDINRVRQLVELKYTFDGETGKLKFIQLI